MAVHLRQKTSPQHLQWCRLLMRVNSDAHAGLAHAGASASGTQWDRSTRRGPMASRTRSTTSARREGTRAREAARRGGSCSSGVLGRAGESSDASGEGGSDVDDVAASRGDHAGVVVRYATGVRANLATRDTPRVRGVATADVMLPGVGNARGRDPRAGGSASARRSPHHLEPPASSSFPSTSCRSVPDGKVKSHPCWSIESEDRDSTRARSFSTHHHAASNYRLKQDRPSRFAPLLFPISTRRPGAPPR